MTRLWQVLFRKSHLASLDLHHDRHQARGALLRMPLLTLEGRSFASRVSANLFSAAGLSEHIAHTPQDHAEKLIELTNIPVRLQTLRKRLEKDVLQSRLLNTPSFVRGLEEAYQQMLQAEGTPS